MKKLCFLISLSCFFQQALSQEIGLQLYSLRNEIPKDVPGSLALIKGWGIKEIEGGGTYGMTIDEFNALAKKNNLKMVSIGADFNELAKDPAPWQQRQYNLGPRMSCAHGSPIRELTLRWQILKMQLLFLKKQAKCWRPQGYRFAITRMAMNLENMRMEHCSI